jgi:hypothetical protein
MNVAWMYFIAYLAEEYGAPVAVDSRDSAFVAADWLFENMPPNAATLTRSWISPYPKRLEAVPTANLLSDAVVDLSAGDDVKRFVIEETHDDGLTWEKKMTAGHKHPIPGLRDPHGDKRIFDGLKASPPTIRVVPKSMSEA